MDRSIIRLEPSNLSDEGIGIASGCPYDSGHEKGLRTPARDFMDRAKGIHPAAKVLVLVKSRNAIAQQEHTSGVFVESDSFAHLKRAIRQLSKAKAAPSLTFEPSSGLFSSLTTRELAVLNAVTQGWSNQTIAWKLGISESTVKATLRHLFARAGVRTRSQLARAALENPA